MTKRISAVIFFLCLFFFVQSQEEGLIYLSEDEGQTWRRADSGLPEDALANDFVLFRNTLYVATEKHGIYRSDDRGKSWQPSNFGVRPNQKVNALTANAATLFAGTYADGVLMSIDGGFTWTPCNNGLTITDLTIRSLEARDGLLFAGTNDGLFASADSGKNWRRLTKEMQINRLVCMDDKLFLATNKGVLFSKDEGENWTWIYEEGAIQTIAVHGTELYATDFNAQIWKTANGGHIWSLAYAVRDDFISAILSLGRQLFASRLSGLFISHSGGLSWEKVPVELPVFKVLKRLGDGTLIAARGVNGC